MNAKEARKKAKEIIAKAIENEMGYPVNDIEYSLSKNTVLMEIWKDEWYLTGNAYDIKGIRICFFSSMRIREILRGGCKARFSISDRAIHLHPL